MQTIPFQMNSWQKKQVSLLYYFASLSYVKRLQQSVNALIAPIDSTLDQAAQQGPDKLLNDKRWSSRNTSENCLNNAWPFLADFQSSITKQLAKRTFEVYSVTGANQCARGLAEQSTDWMTPDEESDLATRFEKISLYAMNIDYTMDKADNAGRWNDFGLTLALSENPDALSDSPALRLRSDVSGNSGTVPPRTGVYLPVDDPHGTPQFCWTGAPAGILQECQTFNDFGLEALADTGRHDLWLSEERMHAFVQKHLADSRLTRDSFFARSTRKPRLAPSLVARQAFISRPCSWIYVEQLHGEKEDWSDNTAVKATANRPRVGIT